MLALERPENVDYPESDGAPVADNTRQYEDMVTTQGGLDALLPDFVAANLFWYPVEGSPEIVQAPDVMVAQGRPKGHRGSYKQWEERDVAPQVVFEILSPGNKLKEMIRKYAFYERYGVEEYYILDPLSESWIGYQRVGGRFEDIADMDGHVSRRLGVRFGYDDGRPSLFYPDGRRFESFLELAAARAAADERAEQESARAEQESARAEREHARAEALLARLRALGVEV